MDNATIILEMLTRIQMLEKKVTELQRMVLSQQKTTMGDMPMPSSERSLPSQAVPTGEGKTKKRDTTKYLFHNEVLAKSRLVLAVVKDYVEQHAPSFEELAQVFHPSLQGSIGVIEHVEVARERQDYTVRFFTAESDVIHLADGDIYVCNQWGILNIPRFLCKAKDLGYKIQEI